MYEVEQNFGVPISVSNYFTTLASPKVGAAIDNLGSLESFFVMDEVKHSYGINI